MFAEFTQLTTTPTSLKPEIQLSVFQTHSSRSLLKVLVTCDLANVVLVFPPWLKFLRHSKCQIKHADVLRITTTGDVSIKHCCSTGRNPCQQCCAIRRGLWLNTNTYFVCSVTLLCFFLGTFLPTDSQLHQWHSCTDSHALLSSQFCQRGWINCSGICISFQSSQARGSCQWSDQ